MSKSPPLKEYYARLGLNPGVSLDEIKRAYRQKAFELHPDLNPSAGAGRQFQQLNEAYVVLIRLLGSQQTCQTASSNQRPDEPRASATAASQAYQEQARQEEAQRRQRQQREFQERAEAERRARERREREEESRRREEKRQRLHEEIERQEQERQKRREQAKAESERQARLREQARLRQAERESERASQPRPESYKRTYAKPGPASAYSAKTEAESEFVDEAVRETLLSDLLNDAFARRVYEDIYSEVRNRREQAQEFPEASAQQPAEGAESDNPVLEFTKTVGDNLKGWLREQIDEEQVLYYPASKLFPGSRIILQIRHGFSHKQKTFEVTLPADFVPGKPLRLRGMGKKLGKWQGDLYLIFQVKN